MSATRPRSPGLGLTADDVVGLGLTCKVTWDDITPEQYCEFRSAPSGVWASAHFSADVVREMRRTQFVKYLQTWRDIVEMKEDCGATARTLAARGPPMWIEDSSGFPLPHGQSHVDRLWFMGDAGGSSEIVSGALDGAPMHPSIRARLAELHSQVYAYFSQDGTGASITLPECCTELMDASVCSDAVCNHVQWLQQKLEPVRTDGGAVRTTVQHNAVQIGSKIPGKYRSNPGQPVSSAGNGSSSDGEKSFTRALPTPAALASVNPAVRPVDSRLNSLAANRVPSPLVRRVHSLALIVAILTSAVALVFLDRTLMRATIWQILRPDNRVPALSGMPAPSVHDFHGFLSQLAEWTAAPAHPVPVAGLGAGFTAPSPLKAALGNMWLNIRQLMRTRVIGNAAF